MCDGKENPSCSHDLCPEVYETHHAVLSKLLSFQYTQARSTCLISGACLQCWEWSPKELQRLARELDKPMNLQESAPAPSSRSRNPMPMQSAVESERGSAFPHTSAVGKLETGLISCWKTSLTGGHLSSSFHWQWCASQHTTLLQSWMTQMMTVMMRMLHSFQLLSDFSALMERSSAIACHSIWSLLYVFVWTQCMWWFP